MRILVLGCGQYQRIDGAEHQDIIPFLGVNHVFDLNEIAWPLKMDHYDKIVCHHVVEHLKSLVRFMNCCHYILKPNGILEIETPNAGMNPDLEFCDPTHTQCYRPGTFSNYFTEYGVGKFGYTKMAWNMSIETFQLEVPEDCIRVIATPIK